MAQSQSVAKGADQGAPDGVPNQKFAALVIGSIGVVYGDIGTSPLYAFREAVHAAQGNELCRPRGRIRRAVADYLGAAAHRHAEVRPHFAARRQQGRRRHVRAHGARPDRSPSARRPSSWGSASPAPRSSTATPSSRPAISVLSAVEGLKLVSPAFGQFVIPLSVVILVGLFAMQSRGTAHVAKYFGPITVVWFVALAIGGLIHSSTTRTYSLR